MTDKTDIDNVRYSFETQEFFQRQIEEAINTLIKEKNTENNKAYSCCLLYTSPSPRDGLLSRMPSSA